MKEPMVVPSTHLLFGDGCDDKFAAAKGSNERGLGGGDGTHEGLKVGLKEVRRRSQRRSQRLR